MSFWCSDADIIQTIMKQFSMSLPEFQFHWGRIGPRSLIFTASCGYLTFLNWFDHRVIKSRYHLPFMNFIYFALQNIMALGSKAFICNSRWAFYLSHRNAECLLCGNQMNLIGTCFKDATTFVYYEWCVCVDYSVCNPRKIIIKTHALWFIVHGSHKSALLHCFLPLGKMAL